MRKLRVLALSAASLLVLVALAACGSKTTKTVTEKASAPASGAADTATSNASQTTTTDEAPAAKPTVDISWDSPQETTHDQVTLKGSVSYGAKVKVSGHRAAVVGTKWSKVVQIKKHGENVYRVTATKKGYDSSGTDASVTRRLSAAEKAVIRQEKAERRANRRALQAAESYLAMSGMSKKGLFEQLSSSAGEGFTQAQAQYAVDHVDADWNKEAVESARSYLDMTPMSRNELIEQLSSSAGEGFTYEQALYAVNKVY
jgi:Host cell surface-exposed lipoprotein